MPAAFATLLAGYRLTPVDKGESGSAVYRLDAEGGAARFLKYGRGRVAADITDEMVRLRWLAGQVPVPSVEYFVSHGDEAWLLTDAAEGRTGDDILADDPERWPEIVSGAAAFMMRLHTIPVATCPFEAGHDLPLLAARANIDAGRVDEDDFDDDHADCSAEDIWRELGHLTPFAAERVVTHGDFSLGNLLFEGGEVTGCIDVGRVGVADPYQDIAILWQNFSEFDGAQNALIDVLNLDPFDERRLRFHRCLDELF